MRGCVEAYCGTNGLLRLAKTDIVAKPSPKALYDAAQSGDERAIDAWQKYGHYLGVAIGNAINTFAPEIVAIGGQIAKASNFFLPTAIETARKNAIPSIFSDTRIVAAEKTDDAGILGAAALALGTI